jgi:hypothetical protein
MKKVLFLLLTLSLLQLQSFPATGNDYSCLRQPDFSSTEPEWRTSPDKNLKYFVSWSFKDPENCIVGVKPPARYVPSLHDFVLRRYSGATAEKETFPAVWRIARDSQMVIVTAEVDFPVALLLGLANRNMDGLGLDLAESGYQLSTPIVNAYLDIKKGTELGLLGLSSSYISIRNLWADWFSKSQGIFPENCQPQIHTGTGFLPSESGLKFSASVLEYGKNPLIEITIEDANDCTFLVFSGPMTLRLGLNKKPIFNQWTFDTLAETPFWHGEAAAYFDSILNQKTQVLSVSNAELAPVYGPAPGWTIYSGVTPVAKLPSQIYSHIDSVVRIGNKLKVRTRINDEKILQSTSEAVTVYLGVYKWFSKNTVFVPGGWRIYSSGSRFSASYAPGGQLQGGLKASYYSHAIKVSLAELLLSPEERAQEESKAKAKAAAELKAKQEADAKAAAPELARLAQQKQSCLQHNIEVENLYESMNQLKNLNPTKFKSYFDDMGPGVFMLLGEPLRFFNSRTESNCDLYGQISFQSEKSSFISREKTWSSVLEWDKKSLARLQLAVMPAKKTTITCVKGKLTKKVTAVNPKCPSGYKKK